MSLILGVWITKRETQGTHFPGGALGRYLSSCILFGFFILLVSSRFALAAAQPQEKDISKNTGEIPDGDATRKVFDKQSFPWYDSLKRDFVPILDKTTPDPPPEISDIGSGSLFTPGPVFFGILLAIIVIALIIFLIRFDWTGIKNDELNEKETRTEIETEKIAALPQAVRGKGDLLGQAEQFASRGQFGDAITYYHSWQLLRLDKAGHIELQSGKTNRSYLGELSGAPSDLRDTFYQSTRLFEDAFYGGLNIEGDAFDSVWKNRARFESPLPPLKGAK